ncbi:Mu transposase C-terminal domain-containing protein [Aeromonas enteropelogenes]|uniref:Mu transposase C-terminal domain-containing protein n=1 Tax=Aeromonas enteropelogenes TaxID=29489 RepID=UPI003B9E65FE
MFFTVKDLAGLPGMPGSERFALIKLNQLSETELTWCRKRSSGKGFEYHIDCLPAETQRYLRKEEAKRKLASLPTISENEIAERTAAEQQAKKERRAGASARVMQMKPEHQQKALVRAGLVYQYQSFVADNKGVKKAELLPMFLELVNTLKLPYAKEHALVIDMTAIKDKTFYRWMKLLRDQGVDSLAIEAKQSVKRLGKTLMDSQPELAELVIAMMVEYPSASPSMMLRAMEAEFGGKYRLPELTALRRWMDDWKAKNANALLAMTNPDGWRNKYMLAFGDASEHVTDLNQLWELDATPADVECVWEGNRKRVHITGVIDVWSRRARMFITETPRASATAQLVRGAILDWGLPEVCKTDNGSDYVAQRLAATFDNLEIMQVLCTPFSPQEKPHIERFFKTFSHDLLELKPGYVGHSVAERKGIESKRSFAKRLMTKGEIIEVRMTPDELQAFCDDWLKVYHHNKHSSIKCSPAERAANYQGEIRQLNDERALDMLLAEPANGDGFRTVSKKGIKVDNIWYIAAELIVGARVHVYYDERDMGRVVVYDANHEFLCIATAPEYLGVSRRAVALDAKQTQRTEIAKAKKQVEQAKRKFNLKDIADKILAHEVEVADELAAQLEPAAQATIYEPATLQAAREAREALESVDREPVVTDSLPPLTVEDLEEVMAQVRKDKGISDESEEEKWKHWLEMDAKEKAGKELSEFELRWRRNYEDTSEFQGRKMVADYKGWGNNPIAK